MKRRELIGVMGLGAAALVATEATALAVQDHEHGHGHDDHLRIIGECAKVCNQTAHHCLEKICKKEGDAKAHAEVHAMAMDCQAFCVLTAALMARSSDLSKYAHDACAEACRCCAETCEKSSEKSDQVQKCARACRDCEKVCRDMSKHMHHAAR